MTEKQASRYLSLSDNIFTRLIEDKIIVANNKLQIEKLAPEPGTLQNKAIN